jgi:glycosyltransferase involved in cell wall biosynthesis
MDGNSGEVVSLASQLLGEGNFSVRSVPHDEVEDYYKASDVFVLGSLSEGFGRVFLEALISGLPVIANEHPVMRFVLGDEGFLLDLSRDGNLAEALALQLKRPMEAEVAAQRRQSVRQRFSWDALAPAYRDMFRDCAALKR